MIENIGCLASVFQKKPESFVKHLREAQNLRELEENDEDPEELMASVQNYNYEKEVGVNSLKDSITESQMAGPMRDLDSDLMNLNVNDRAKASTYPPPMNVSSGGIDDLLDVGGNNENNYGNNSYNPQAETTVTVTESQFMTGSQKACNNVVIPYSVENC